ncbi:MAG: TetR/AcrR family transcriptional regulator [Chlorobiaceae bacterium]|nr:TetR/AcrR family transcriptional regulator [Chlorobiaceae bacterium]
MTPSRQEEQRGNLGEAIKEAAWEQIAEAGASSLSLRAIGRALGITAPAIYNYYEDRDALVTALVIDAFNSFGDRQLAARDEFPGPGQELERLRATGLAYRQWALDHPHRYLLIFGNPVPGYQPPMQELLPVMMRSLSALTGCISELHALGRIDLTAIPRPLCEPGNRFFAMLEPADDEARAVYALAMLIWSRVHGQVSLEITGQLPPFPGNGAALYEFELDSIARQFILPN